MKKMLFTAIVTLLAATSAHAGSSLTTLACSSESGRTIISGVLPGQGEMEIRLNFSVGTNMIVFASDENANNGAEASVKLDGRANKAVITVKTKSANLSLVSIAGKSNLKSTMNGTKGSFEALLTGTHPETYEAITQAIVVRCHASDEI